MTAARQAGRVLGVPGALLVIAGGVLLVVAFGLLDWYDAPRTADAAPKITFGELHGSADQLGGAAAATAYFDWLAWVLLIALVGIGMGANLPVRPADALRVAGFALGAIGVAATYFAIVQLHNAQVAAGGGHHGAFHNATWGVWLTFTGFTLGALGAALGPRRAVRE
jgi:hypothetical protein